MGGVRYALIKVNRDYDSYTRNTIIVFTNTGGTARCVMLSLMTTNGTLAVYQYVLAANGTGFNGTAVGYWSGSKPYVKLDISGSGTWDYVTLISQTDFTLERANS